MEDILEVDEEASTSVEEEIVEEILEEIVDEVETDEEEEVEVNDKEEWSSYTEKIVVSEDGEDGGFSVEEIEVSSLAEVVSLVDEDETDHWRDHFERQHEHFFNNSQSILDFYEEEVLEIVYDTEVFVDDAQSAPLDMPQVNQSSPAVAVDQDGSKQQDNIMKRLARKREEQRQVETKTKDNDIMKRLSKSNQVKDKRNYERRKYKPRMDPYMDELKETVTTWFSCDDREDGKSQALTMGGQPVNNPMSQDVPEAPDVDIGESDTTPDQAAISPTAPPTIEPIKGVVEDFIDNKGNGMDEESQDASVGEQNESKEKMPSALEVDPLELDSSSTPNEDFGSKGAYLVTNPPNMTETTLDQSEKGNENLLRDCSNSLHGQASNSCGREKAAPKNATPKDCTQEQIEKVIKVPHCEPEAPVITREGETDPTLSPRSSENSIESIDGVASTDTKKLNSPSSSKEKDGLSERLLIDALHETSDSNLEEQANKSCDAISVLKHPTSPISPVFQESSVSPVSTGKEKAATSLCVFEDVYKMPEPLEPAPSPYEKKYGSLSRSPLHHFIEKGEWKKFQECITLLKSEEALLIQREMTQTDEKRNSTPLHVCITKAPTEMTTLLLSLIPFDFRENILMAVDDDGNTPLHIACQYAPIPIVKVLTLGAPRVNCMRNYAGKTPLKFLLASPGMKAVAKDTENTFEDVAAELVQSILTDEPSLIGDRDEDDSTLLHTATANGVFDKVLKAILITENGPSLTRTKDQYGMLPIHNLSACTSGRMPFAKSAKRLIAAYPESVCEASDTGDTPLHLFVSNVASWIADKKEFKSSNTSKLVEVLLGDGEHGSPLLMRNNDGLFPLHCCVRLKTPLEIVSVIMKDKNAEKGSIQKDTESATPLHNICSSPNVGEMVEWIQIVGTRKSALAKDKDKNTPLLVAIENRKVTKSVIIALAALNPEAAKIDNAKGKSPFHAAIRKKAEEDVVKEVIKMHPKAVKKVSFKGNNNIFHEMCQYETAAGIISGLLSVHPDGAKSQNDKGNLPLHVAAAYHVSPQIINALVKAYPEGCLVQNTTKEIPLHYAVGDDEAKEATVSALLKAAPESVIAKDKKGRTPMDVAKEAEVSIDVYEVLRKFYKEQAKDDAKSIAVKSPTKRKKKGNGLENSQASLDSESPSQAKQRRKKKKDKVGLHDSVAVITLNTAAGIEDTMYGSMNLNDMDSGLGMSPSGLDESIRSKSKKKNRKDRDSTPHMIKKTFNEHVSSRKNSGEPSKSIKSKVESIKSTGSVKSKRRTGDKGDASTRESIGKSKSKRSCEGASLFTTPKSRKNKVHSDKETKTPKTPKPTSLLDSTEHAVKTPKSSKRSKGSSTVSPDSKSKSLKTPKSVKSTSQKKKNDEQRVPIDPPPSPVFPVLTKTPKSASSAKTKKKRKSKLEDTLSAPDL